MPRYLDPKNDLTFRKIFGEHPYLLISFLNALMPLEPGKLIEKVEYLLSEQVPETPPFDKNSIVDVRYRDNRGRQFIVEMQIYCSELFRNRMVFNASKAYVRQTKTYPPTCWRTIISAKRLPFVKKVLSRRKNRFFTTVTGIISAPKKGCPTLQKNKVGLKVEPKAKLSVWRRAKQSAG